MVSEFRKKKLLHMFTTFFDTDKSGSLTKQDFEQAAKKVAEVKGYAADDPMLKRVENGLLKIWNLLQSQGDTDNDGEISKEEWIAMWDGYTKNPSSSSVWQDIYSKSIFGLVDSGGDGVIDETEYTNYYVNFGISKEDAAKAFKKASGGKSSLIYEEYQKLWKEYFLSEDEDAPGNYIFGIL